MILVSTSYKVTRLSLFGTMLPGCAMSVKKTKHGCTECWNPPRMTCFSSVSKVLLFNVQNTCIHREKIREAAKTLVKRFPNHWVPRWVIDTETLQGMKITYIDVRINRTQTLCDCCPNCLGCLVQNSRYMTQIMYRDVRITRQAKQTFISERRHTWSLSTCIRITKFISHTCVLAPSTRPAVP
jgi:hypothetical protein